MSCNYADGLSPYENKGKLGLPEIKEDITVVVQKAQLLAQWIKDAKHVVFHTGAGISTQAGIPDFRGPNGVWTLEQKGLKPNINTSFDMAEPTKTHMILRTLIEQGYAKFIISQNIDGLHLKSGIKRTHLAELHGNMFVAKCSFCDKFTVLGQCASTVGERPIGLDCPFKKTGGRPCRGRLHDTLLDWEANLPINELDSADGHSTLADLSICLGTTLQIVPAGNLPLRAKKNPNGRLVIINLQNTKHDKKADLIINSTVDAVMEKVAEHLGITPIAYSADIDTTKLLQRRMEAQKTALIDWTIPASAIRQLKNQVKSMPKKEVVKRKPKKRKRSLSRSSSEKEECANIKGVKAVDVVLEITEFETKHEDENTIHEFSPVPVKAMSPSTKRGESPCLVLNDTNETNGMLVPTNDNDDDRCTPIASHITPNDEIKIEGSNDDLAELGRAHDSVELPSMASTSAS